VSILRGQRAGQVGGVMASTDIGTCVCGSRASLRDSRCSQCRAVADLARYPRDRVLTVPLGLLSSGLPIHARVLASAGFTPARIAALLDADERDVRRVLG
jgi:hypothetical protein